MASEDQKEGKKVAEEVSNWLQIYDDGSVDRKWTGPSEALFLMAPVLAFDSPRDGITIHDLPTDPLLRLYLPQRPPHDNKLLPVLLHFHGGGFCISHASWFIYYQFYSRLAASIPAVVVSVELPLAPEHRLPAAIGTAHRALLWLRALAREPSPDQLHAARLQSAADFSRVFLIGDSSGANLVHEIAAQAGMEAEIEEGFWAPLRVAGGVLLHPGFVRAARSKSELENQPDSPFLTLEMVEKFLALGLPLGATKDHPYTCPMGLEAPSMVGLRVPPLLVAVAERDLIRDTQLEYVEAMKTAGKKVEAHLTRGLGHTFYLNAIAQATNPHAAKRTNELIQAIKDFVHGQ